MSPRNPYRHRKTTRRRAGMVAAVLVVVAGAAAHGPVGAQTPPPGGTTPTTSLLGGLLGKLLPTTTPPTTAPPAAGGGAQPPGPPPGAPKEVVCASASAAPGRRGPRTGPRSTDAVLGALAARRELGYSPEELAAGMGQFPVGGSAHYSDDWLDPRQTPCPHRHMGTDIFAARGTPVRAPEDGVVRFSEEAVGGKAAYVSGSSGTLYYMAHLDRFAAGLAGSHVARGQVVGFVGSTGNADGGAPHLHFQVHPGGGAPVNPKPVLDRWLDEALAAVPSTFPERQAEATGTPRALTVVADLRRFDAIATNGTDDPLAVQQQDWEEAAVLVRALLDPLGPPSLDALLASPD